jgi:hypothetical protein
MTLKECPGYRDRNPNFIDDNKDSLPDADDLEEAIRPLNLNRGRFTRAPNNADYRDLTESSKLTPARYINLPGSQRPYI